MDIQKEKMVISVASYFAIVLWFLILAILAYFVHA